VYVESATDGNDLFSHGKAYSLTVDRLENPFCDEILYSSLAAKASSGVLP
jgi:hypothetical protein